MQYHRYEIQVKLLHISVMYYSLQKMKHKRLFQRITQSFVEAFISHDKHTLFALEESEPHRRTYTYESQ
jgi:hypothetical protein